MKVENFDDFIFTVEGEQRKILGFLHSWLKEEVTLICKIRYNIPFYYRNSWICYLNPIKSQKIEMAFIRGNELSNNQGLLQFKNRSQVAGVEFTSISDIKLNIINEIIQEAILLDEKILYQSKRRLK